MTEATEATNFNNPKIYENSTKEELNTDFDKMLKKRKDECFKNG